MSLDSCSHHLFKIPDNIVIHSLSFLDIKDLLRFSNGSRKCREMAFSDELWRSIANKIGFEVPQEYKKGDIYPLVKRKIKKLREKAKKVIMGVDSRYISYHEDTLRKPDIGMVCISDLKILREQIPIIAIWRKISHELWMKNLYDVNNAHKPEFEKLEFKDLKDITNSFDLWLVDNKTSVSKLTELNFVSSLFGSIPKFIFKWTNLKNLSLHFCKLTSLSSSIGTITTLTSINLCRNKLKDLPESFGNLRELKDLTLNNNEFEEVPDCIKTLLKLESLWLTDNRLKEIPDFIGNFKQMRQLNIGTNQITALPGTITQLENLEGFIMYENQIRFLPLDFGNLKKLKMFRASNNQIVEIPESIGSLIKLRGLDLSENKLKKIPSSIGGLTKLFWLELSSNEITLLPDAFSELKDLKNVELNHNPLEALPESIFDLPALEKLHLYKTSLDSVDETRVKNPRIFCFFERA